MRATRSEHVALLNLLTGGLCDEKYKFWSSSLCSFLHPLATLSLSLSLVSKLLRTHQFSIQGNTKFYAVSFVCLTLAFTSAQAH